MPQWQKAQQITVHKAREALGEDFGRVQRTGVSMRFEDALSKRALLAGIAAIQPPRTGASSPSGS